MRFLKEEEFIEELSRQFPAKGAVGIGDDCAVIPGKGNTVWLITTDALVEGVHFLKEQISPKDLGYKTVAVSVSDIAAKGGEPKYAFLSIAMPKIEAKWASELISGIKEAALEWDLALLGGDTVGSRRDLFLNLTLIGSAQEGKILYRHGAKVGDRICVTSTLGDSGGGLKILQEHLPQSEDGDMLLRAHFRPKPSPEQGAWLSSQVGVHAMMDLSDGLDCDLGRLITSSRVGASIQVNSIPLSDSLKRVSKEHGWDSTLLALTGGEDYCLLCTVDPTQLTSIQRSFQDRFATPLFEVGAIAASPPVISYFRDETPIITNYNHFNHFADHENL